jgi:hypothetical protein
MVRKKISKFFSLFSFILIFPACGDFSPIEEYKTIKLKLSVIEPNAEGLYLPFANSGKFFLEESSFTAFNSNLGAFNQIMAGVHVGFAGLGPFDIKAAGGELEVTVPVVEGEEFDVGVVAWNCGSDTLCNGASTMPQIEWYFAHARVSPSEAVQNVDLYMGGIRPINSSAWICEDDGNGTGTADNNLCETDEKANEAKIVFFGPPDGSKGINTGYRTLSPAGQVELPNFGEGPGFDLTGRRGGNFIGHRHFEMNQVGGISGDTPI